MEKVIDIASRRKPDRELEAMLRFSNYIDSLITEELKVGVVEPQNLVAVLSHRVGTFIAAINCTEEERENLLNHSLELILNISLNKKNT